VVDYSGMSYAELVRMANDDAVADRMSDEEYESLSRELWKKFGVEKRMAPPKARSAASAGLKVRSFFHAWKREPVAPARENSPATGATSRLPSLSRSGD
jgi:hypothetical protein